jgi:hypothetical protein
MCEIFDILELVIRMQQQAYSSQANYSYIIKAKNPGYYIP